MTAYNVVRFRVKPDREKEFLDRHRKIDRTLPGMRRFTLIKVGDSAYCVVGEWQSFEHLTNARPQMIGILDTFRHCLEDLGNGLGISDPVSGEAVMEFKPAAKKATRKKAPAKKKAKSARRKPAKKAKRKKAK